MSLSNEDQTFLKTYDDSKYAKPSVTADMVIFSRFSDGSLQVLLIRRGANLPTRINLHFLAAL